MTFTGDSVPIYPKMTIEVGEDNGIETATLNGKPLPDFDPAQENATEALIAAVAELAAQRSGRVKAYRVRAVNHGQTFHLAVNADGEVADLTPAPPKNRARLAALAAAGLATVAGLGTCGVVVVRDDAPAPTHTVVQIVTPRPEPVEAPQLAPAGFSEHARWASDEVPANAQIATTRDLIVTPTGKDATRALSGLNAATGKPQWSFRLPRDFQIKTGPTWSTIDGQRVLVIASNERLLTLSSQGKKILDVPLASTSETIVTPSGVAVTTEHAAKVLVRGSLQPRALPAGSTPLGARGGELVAADDDGKVWHVTGEKVAPDPVSTKAPKGMHVVKTLALTTSGEVIQAVTRGTSARDYELVRARRDGTPRWRSDKIEGSPEKITLAPDTSWAVIGHRTVSLTSGDTHSLADDWQTVAVSDDFAWGKTADGLLTATPSGLTKASRDARKSSSDDSGTPLGSAGGLTIMLAQDDQGPRLFALEPEAS